MEEREDIGAYDEAKRYPVPFEQAIEEKSTGNRLTDSHASSSPARCIQLYVYIYV